MTQAREAEAVLSEEEIAELRARVRKELEAEEEERIKALQRQRESHASRTARVREIEQEEEERFYQERGYRRFVDRSGNVRWLSPEQASRWEEERALHQRRRRAISYRLASRKTRRLIVIAVAGVTLALFAVFLAVLRRG
ncbi:hypothetical protein JXA88_14560 [Candidatus Fermentibacteria bacterium]|nr:hypothetical protein [Candidatus Fermentibacteria bacterium]